MAGGVSMLSESISILLLRDSSSGESRVSLVLISLAGDGELPDCSSGRM